MLADKIAANRARHAAQAAAHEARRVARGLAPRGRLKIDLAGRHAGTFTVPATWRLWGSVTTPDGIAGALYREDGGTYWQAAEDFARTLHVEDVRAALHFPPFAVPGASLRSGESANRATKLPSSQFGTELPGTAKGGK